MRSRLALLLVLCLASLADGARLSGQWRPLKIGAGGYVTGITVSNDGSTRCVRTDTYGAYCYDFQNAIWRQVMRPTSMPAADVSPGGNGDGFGKGGGVYEIVVAPNLPTRLYMARAGKVFRSNDRAATWTATNFTPLTVPDFMEANDGSSGHKFAGQKMAVDPSDPNVVLAASCGIDGNVVPHYAGLFRTADGGTSWNAIASVPATGCISGIAFGSSGTVWLVSAASGAAGAYKSTDNGLTFTLQAGGPNGASGQPWMGVARGGNYWATFGPPAGSTKLWFNNAGAWTDCTPLAGPMLAPMGFDINAAGTRVAAAHNGSTGTLISVRYGNAVCSSATWDTAFSTHSESYPNMGWLSSALAALVPLGGSAIGINKAAVAYDPQVDKIWVTSGVGVWSVVASAVAPNLAWTEESKGIEQLVTNQILVAPTSGAGGTDVPLIANWDFGNRRSADPEVYQSATWQPGTKFLATWSFDYANDDPNFIVVHNGWAGPCEPKQSVDNGQNWTALNAGGLAQLPGGNTDCFSTWGRGGQIAVSTKLNWVWLPGPTDGVNPRAAYYTTDGGLNWSKVVLPSPMVDTADTTVGWRAVFKDAPLNRIALVADRGTNNVFYMYAWAQGLMKSVNSGATWTWADGANPPANPLVNNGGFDDTQFNAKLAAVPGKTGNLFFTSGQQDNTGGNIPQGNPLYRSINSGLSFTKVSNVLEVTAIGFGRNVTQSDGSTYPRILIAGWVSGVWGIWKSDDNATTWVKIPGSSGTNYPLDVFDSIGAIEGDKTGDKIYVSFRGSGAGYYSFGDDTFSGVVFHEGTIQNIGGGSGPQCSDGIDNDGDALIDFPADPGCTDASDNDEDDWTAMPQSFNDPIFTGMTTLSNPGGLGFGTLDHKSITGRHANPTSASTIDANASPWTLQTSRFATSDTTMFIGPAGNGSAITIKNSFIHVCGCGQNVCCSPCDADHPDGILSYGPTNSPGSPVFSEDISYTFFDQTPTAASDCTVVGTGIRHGDQGRPQLVKLNHVYFKSGQGIRIHTPDTGPWTTHIDFQDVCMDGSDIAIDNWNNNGAGGSNSIVVDRWVNVRNCTIVGGIVVPGAQISCTAAVNDISTPGTVTGCPGTSVAQCSDSIDNDGDGVIDYPGDAGCTSPYDNAESGDNTVVVSGAIAGNTLNTCIAGTDQANCNNVLNVASAATTVCSGTGSVCNTSGTRQAVGQFTCSNAHTCSLEPQRNNVSYVHLAIGNFYLNTRNNFRLVDSTMDMPPTWVNAGFPAGEQPNNFAQQSNFGVLANNIFDGNPGNSGCSVGDAALQIFCTGAGCDGWRITNNTFRDFYDDCANSSDCIAKGHNPADPLDHSEALYLGGVFKNALVSTNTFTNNGSTSHLFLTVFPAPTAPNNVCITGNTWGARGGAFTCAGSGAAFFDVNCNTVTAADNDAVTPNGAIATPNCGSIGRACIAQCNDGIDNDSDGKIDYWPDGLGDTGCTGFTDNSE